MSTRVQEPSAGPQLADKEVIKAEGMCVGYGAISVIRDLDLQVNAGEVVALLGANGAGKTTILRALAGILTPTAGTIRLRGALTQEPLHRRSRKGLAYVPEERGVFRSLTTLENLRLGQGEPEVALELMPELRPLLNRRAGLLSGGEQQMLSVARALAGEPAVLLVDELSLGLAPLIVGRLLERLRSAAQRGIGVLLVEQQARVALGSADRAYILARGRVALSGAADELGKRFDEIEAHYLSGVG